MDCTLQDFPILKEDECNEWKLQTNTFGVNLADNLSTHEYTHVVTAKVKVENKIL